jgi:hypothetical protein
MNARILPPWGALLACGTLLVPQAFAAGEKIEFSTPTEPAPVKPLTGSDLEARPFNFQRSDLGDNTPSASISAITPLPAPDQVNRARALQQWLERRNGWARPEFGGEGDEMGSDLDPSASGTEVTIDDLFRHSTRGGEGRAGRDARYDSRNQRPADRTREGDRMADPGDVRSTSRMGGRGTDENALGAGSQDGRAAAPDFLADGSAARPDRFLSLSGFLPQTTVSAPGADSLRARNERLESFRRLLGPTISAGGVPVGPGTVGMDGVRTVLPGGPPSGPTGARAVGDALGVRGATAGASGGEADPAQRSLVGPVRPSELDLSIGREGVRASTMPSEAPAPLKPMELFQRKHDRRLPTRDF